MPAPVTIRRLAWAALVGAGAVVFWAALQPDLAPPGEFHADKLIHVGAFAVLGGLAALASASRLSLLLWFVALTGLGAGIEIAQAMVPDRSMSFADLLSDIGGISAGMAARWFLAAMGSARFLRPNRVESVETP